MRDTFYLDGIDAAEKGIYLQRPIEFEGRVPDVTSEHVLGRNGDVVFDTGAYLNMKGRAVCFALDKNVANAITGARSFLQASQTYRRLVTDYDPDHFIMARVANGPAVENRLNKLNPFEIEFDCKPKFFLFSGEQEISISSSGQKLINNHGGAAEPLIVVHGSGTGTITIGGCTIQLLDVTDGMVLDCDAQAAYKGADNLNADVYAPEFPKLYIGENIVAFTGGIISLAITPRWWD